MALVQTRQDLLRFDLTLPGMQMIILHVPRLRVLLGTSPGLLFDSVRSMVEQQKLLEIPRRDSARYGLIPELVPQPYSGISGEILDKRLLTLGQAIYRSQFLEGGYYEEGHVQFEGDQGEGHFITEASKGHTLAIALANRAFETWKQMLPQEGPFYVLECGAGDGDLCYKILRFVHFMARKNSQWRQFEEKIHYTILELSSALVKRQKHTLCNLIATNKVEVIQGNALSMDKFIKKKVHLQLSNELADMFASEQIVINKEGECEVSMVVPVLTYAAYAFLSEHHADCVAILIDEAKKYKLLLDYHSINILNRGYVLTAQRFQKLVAITANKNFKGPGECFRYDHTSLPLSFFPEIEDYLAEHPEIFAGMRVNDTKIVCPQLDTYARQLVRNSAVSIVVDYGGLSIDLRNSSYRTFGSTDLCYRHFPLFKVGALDVTYDVDFSALVSALKRLAPQGRANLICMIGLLPAKLELPGVYQGLCDFSTDCREFLAAIYVSGEVNVHFPDTNASKVPFVNPHQFFQAATSVAREIIRINLSGVAHNGDNNQRVI